MKTIFSTRNTLLLIRFLADVPSSTNDLCKELGCSVATIKRMIAAARRMGAEIEALVSKNPPSYTFQLKNWQQIKPTVEKWIQQFEAIQKIESVHALRPNILKIPQSNPEGE